MSACDGASGAEDLDSSLMILDHQDLFDVLDKTFVPGRALPAMALLVMGRFF